MSCTEAAAISCIKSWMNGIMRVNRRSKFTKSRTLVHVSPISNAKALSSSAKVLGLAASIFAICIRVAGLSPFDTELRSSDSSSSPDS